MRRPIDKNVCSNKTSECRVNSTCDLDDVLVVMFVRRRDGRTCLRYAARNGKVECLRYLLEEREHSVDSRSEDGTMPLHLACFGACPYAVQYLIDKGADILAKNDSLWRSLRVPP